MFKYYRNVGQGAEKSSKAYELIMPNDGDLTSPEGISKISETMIEEMKGGIEHNVKDIGD